jgi:hypothetical protein
MSDGEPYNVIPMQGLRRTSNAAFGHQCRSAGAGGILKTAVCDCMRRVESMNWPGDVLQVLGVTNVITAGIAWLVRELVKASLGRDLERHKASLQSANQERQIVFAIFR